MATTSVQCLDGSAVAVGITMTIVRIVFAVTVVQKAAELQNGWAGCSEVGRSGRTRLTFATTAIAMIQCLQDLSSSRCKSKVK